MSKIKNQLKSDDSHKNEKPKIEKDFLDESIAMPGKFVVKLFKDQF